MDSVSEYQQQLEAIKQMLGQSPEGPEKDQLISLKQNIEELLSLTDQVSDSVSSGEGTSTDNQKYNDLFDNEYARFMAEINESLEPSNENGTKSDIKTPTESLNEYELKSENFKHLEGKKFRVPHEHQWGQTSYHNAMVCSVPPDIDDITKLEVKVLFLNPTHPEMLPCPYYFDVERDCRFSDDKCRFSHGQLVPYSSLQDYIEPRFDNLGVGSEVLAKQADDLWYRGKIEQMFEEKCLVKFESKSSFVEIIFEHILPLTEAECDSDRDSIDEDANNPEEFLASERFREDLINKSLLIPPDSVALGDWEKHTRGIGSKLMQKMGYIVGTGLGKDGSGIVKPVTALILPQGKSLDFCMNLKEESKDPHLFHADRRSKVSKWKERRTHRRRASRIAQQQVKLEQMELEKYIRWYLGHSKLRIDEKECDLLREKLKVATIKEVNVANFMLEKKVTSITEAVEELKVNIRRLEEKHVEAKNLYKKLEQRKTDLKRLNGFRILALNELSRRKNNRELAVF